MPESNVDSQVDQLYDREGDVYYVSFGTGEPSYCVEVDDELVIEVGVFSNLPTGYRLLNMSKIKTEEHPLDHVKDRIKERLRKVLRGLPQTTMGDREAAVERSLDKVLA